MFCQICLSHYVWGKFSNSWCANYWKMQLTVKTWNLEVFTHAPSRQNSPLGSYRHSPGRECFHYTESLFSSLNGRSISHWASLERFLFPFRTKQTVFYLALTLMKKPYDQRNYAQLSISGTERNVSLSEAKRSNYHAE